MSPSNEPDELFDEYPRPAPPPPPPAAKTKTDYKNVTLPSELTKVADCFSDLTVDSIKTPALKLGMSFGNANKSGIVAIIARELKKNMKRYLDALEPVDRYVVTDLAHFGSVNHVQFQALHNLPLPKYDFSAYYYGEKSRHCPLVCLLARMSREQLTMPEPLRELIREYVPMPEQPTVRSSTSYPETISISPKNTTAPPRKVHFHEGGQKTLLEARSVLRQALLGKIKVTPKTRRPTSATIEKINSALAGADYILDQNVDQTDKIYYTDIPPGPVRAHAWPVLLQQMKWARPKSETLILTAEGKAFLETRDIALWPSAVENYLNDDHFDELNRIDNIRGQTGKAKSSLSLPGDRKGAIAELLNQFPVGEWVEFDEVFRQMVLHKLDYPFIENRGLWYLYFHESRYDSLGYVHDNPGEQHPLLWRQYLRATLMESFATLGIIDIAYVAPHEMWPEFQGYSGLDDKWYLSRYDGLLAIRLNELGAYALRMTEQFNAAAEKKTSLQLLPNLDIVVEAEQTPPEDRIVLERFAQQVNERLWRLDRAILLRSLHEGMKTNEVLEYLTARASRGIPDTVRHALDSWTSRTQAIKSVSNAVLIEFRDSHDAMLLAHDTAARKLCQPAGSNCVVVSHDKLRALQKAAQELGFVFPIMKDKVAKK